MQCLLWYSDVGTYLKLGGQVVMCVWGHYLPPLVEIGVTDLPKPGWATAHPAHQSTTSLPGNTLTGMAQGLKIWVGK